MWNTTKYICKLTSTNWYKKLSHVYNIPVGIHLYIHIFLSVEEIDNNRIFDSKGEALILTFLRQYKDISKNKFCSRGICGGSYHDTNTSILKSSFVIPIASCFFSFLMVCQDNSRMNILKWFNNQSTIIHHQPLFFKIFCIKWGCR